MKRLSTSFLVLARAAMLPIMLGDACKFLPTPRISSVTGKCMTRIPAPLANCVKAPEDPSANTLNENKHNNSRAGIDLGCFIGQ